MMTEKQVMRIARADAEKLIQFCGYLNTSILDNAKLATKMGIYHEIQPNDAQPAELADMINAAIKHAESGGKFEVFSEETAETAAVAASGEQTADTGEKPKRGRKPKADKPPKAEKPPKPPKEKKEGARESMRGDKSSAVVAGRVLREMGMEGGVTDEKLARYRGLRDGKAHSTDRWYFTTAYNAIKGYMDERLLPSPTQSDAAESVEPAAVDVEPTAVTAG